MKVLVVPINVKKEMLKLQRFVYFVNQLCREARNHLASRLEEYPPYQHLPWKMNQNSSVPGGFHTERQRRYVMAKLSSGEWGHSPPYYKRSGKMKDSWKRGERIGKRKAHFWVRHDQRFHNRRGHYVQGPGFQHWRMEQMGWPTEDTVVEKYWADELYNIQLKAVTWRP